jgi:hypothetical protein
MILIIIYTTTEQMSITVGMVHVFPVGSSNKKGSKRAYNIRTKVQ